jgi:hypothetical protein
MSYPMGQNEGMKNMNETSNVKREGARRERGNRDGREHPMDREPSNAEYPVRRSQTAATDGAGLRGLGGPRSGADQSKPRGLGAENRRKYLIPRISALFF